MLHNVACGVNQYIIKRSSNLSLYSLDSNLAPALLANHSPKCAYKSQLETILADLNRYMAATRLIILMDDAIKHVHLVISMM